MAKIKHKYPLITVTWADHYASETNKPYSVEEVKEEYLDPCIRETSGYLIAENRRVLCIAGTIEEDGTVTELNSFMKRCVLSRSDQTKKSHAKTPNSSRTA